MEPVVLDSGMTVGIPNCFVGSCLPRMSEGVVRHPKLPTAVVKRASWAECWDKQLETLGTIERGRVVLPFARHPQHLREVVLPREDDGMFS